MKRNMFVLVICVFSIILSGAMSLFAVDYTWTNSVGGSFDTAGNWDPAVVPGSADTALFTQGSSTRATVTFPAGTTTTAGLTLNKSGSDNKYEFSIANGGTPAIYDAGATVICNDYDYRADLLLSAGTLISSTVKFAGYDSRAGITLDGADVSWIIKDNFDCYQSTLDLYVQNGATLEAQGASGTSHDLWTEHLDSNRGREQYIRVSGAGSSITFTNINTICQFKGNTWFEVLDGAVATFDNIIFSQSDTDFSNVYVVVSNAIMNTKELSFTGSKTYGHFNVLDGASVYSDSDVKLDGWDSKNIITTIDNSALTLSGKLYVGYNGQVSLIVTNGGVVTGTNSVYMYFPALDSISTNSITITGAGSIMKLGGMYPGGGLGTDKHSPAILSVLDGGVLEQTSSDIYRFMIWSNGVVNIDSGTIINASTIVNRGTLQGSGIISNSVIVDVAYGSVRPGNQVGQLNIGGTYTQTAGLLELGITNLLYDVLSVTGNVSITGGSIDVLMTGEVPAGATVNYDVIVSQGTISTNGATVNLPVIPKVTWTSAIVNEGAGDILRVTAESSVPIGTLVTIN